MSANTSSDRTEAIQAVVDRVSSYQDGAPEGTVEKELRSGLADAGLELGDGEITALAEAVEAEHGNVDVSKVLAD
ncbi:hypothetical protein GCM10009795_009090 [Nocardioides hankookensis]|uniref:Uncharacterized protein n=1 Tax=Nocardioides hankookensis TaxID=443157 RepID=A0ABW1LIK9_9ACTN